MTWAGNIAKTMTSNGKQFTVTREMLTAVAGISARDSKFAFVLFCPLGNIEFSFPRLSMFLSTSSRETLRLSGNKIHCAPRDQSLSVYCFPLSLKFAHTWRTCPIYLIYRENRRWRASKPGIFNFRTRAILVRSEEFPSYSWLPENTRTPRKLICSWYFYSKTFKLQLLIRTIPSMDSTEDMENEVLTVYSHNGAKRQPAGFPVLFPLCFGCKKAQKKKHLTIASASFLNSTSRETIHENHK